MKKIKLLAPIIGATTLVATVPAVASCNSQVKTLSVVSTKTYKVGDSLTKDDLQISLNGSKLASGNWKLMTGNKEIETYVFTDDTAVTFSVIYENNKTTFDVKAEKDESIYEKENTYLREKQFIEPIANEVSHNIQFELKEALGTGETLEAEIVDYAATGNKVITEGKVDLENYRFGKLFYVPVKHIGGTVYRWNEIGNFSVKISCVKGSTTVWSNTYDDMYIKFTAINAWAGYDYRGYTNDIARMDNWHYVKNMWQESMQWADAYHMPFPIELREPMNSANELKAVIYDSHVYWENGTERDDVTFGLQTADGTNKNWIRQKWDTTNNWYPFTYELITSTIQADAEDKRFKKCYDVFVEFKPQDEYTYVYTHNYATFNLIVYAEDKTSHEIKWVENFTGCKMTFLDHDYNGK